jgi:hypothetical protein
MHLDPNTVLSAMEAARMSSSRGHRPDFRTQTTTPEPDPKVINAPAKPSGADETQAPDWSKTNPATLDKATLVHHIERLRLELIAAGKVQRDDRCLIEHRWNQASIDLARRLKPSL